MLFSIPLRNSYLLCQYIWFSFLKLKLNCMLQKPSNPFIGASWAAMGIGIIGYLIGLWRSDMQLNEKGYYFTVVMFGLFSAVSVQKAVRDKLENIAVTDIYYGLSWAAVLLCIVLLAVGLFNASMLPSEKGFYAFAFVLAIFGSIAVQKNTRDSQIPKT
jgi:uncharacterized membrane protein YiaA